MKILIADDNEINRQFLCGVLGKKHEIVEVIDGAQAISQCQKERFDVILMDIRMPGVDGREATQIIRQFEDYKHIPIIALTADLHLQQTHDLTDQGFSLCLTKPVSRANLLSALKKIDSEAFLSSPDNPVIADPGSLPIDWDAALAAAGGNEALVKKLCAMLSKELDEFLPKIRTLINDPENYGEAKDMAHKLQGSAGFCSAAPLQSAAASFELAVADRDQGTIQESFKTLELTGQQLQAFLEQS